MIDGLWIIQFEYVAIRISIIRKKKKGRGLTSLSAHSLSNSLRILTIPIDPTQYFLQTPLIPIYSSQNILEVAKFVVQTVNNNSDYDFLKKKVNTLLE